MLVNRVDPVHFLRLHYRINVGNVHHNGLVVRAHEHALKRLVRAGIDFLMRHEGRHIDEISGPSLGHILEVVAPPHTGLAAHHVDHTLKLAMVVHAGLGVGLDGDGPGPDLLGPDTAWLIAA